MRDLESCVVLGVRCALCVVMDLLWLMLMLLLLLLLLLIHTCRDPSSLLFYY
jgi:hypothetical protein